MTSRQGYFDRHPSDWDGIYNAPRGSARARLNRRLRRAVWGRMAIALQETAEIAGRSALDVGCGPGEMAIRMAERGASRVVGIDSAAEMVRVATMRAASRGTAEQCHFIHADFMSSALAEQIFDYTVALGVLDYVTDAERFLDRMWNHTRTRMVVSFPRDVPPRSWLRRIWHGAHGSRLHYYGHDRARGLAVHLEGAAIRMHAIHGSDSTDVVVWDRVDAAGAVPAPVSKRTWGAQELEDLLKDV